MSPPIVILFTIWDFAYKKTLFTILFTIESRLCGPLSSGFLDYTDFLCSQFCNEYLLVMIKIPSNILFKTATFKSEVKASLFRFQKTKARTDVTNEEHSHEVWLAWSCFVAKWDFTLVRRGIQDVSECFYTVITSFKRKRSVLSVYNFAIRERRKRNQFVCWIWR